MNGVVDLSNKDTGNIPGDTSFVISKKDQSYYCAHHPDEFICKNVAQFTGDDPNSTDLVLEMNVEVDGQWGPYLECNPLNITEP